MSTGRYSRQALAQRLGESVMADVERCVREAPKPGPEAIALVQRIFGPGMRRLRAEASQSERHSLAA